MQEPGFISYVDYIQQRDCITLLPSSWVDVIRNNGIKSNHKIKDPDKKRAEDTLSSATQLLRSVYEIDCRTNSFTPACLLSANFLALFLSTPHIHTLLWPFPHVHILQTQDGCLCPLKIRMTFLSLFLLFSMHFIQHPGLLLGDCLFFSSGLSLLCQKDLLQNNARRPSTRKSGKPYIFGWERQSLLTGIWIDMDVHVTPPWIP